MRSTPNASTAYRTAAWHHLQSESRAAGGRDLARSTADLLFLIDNPRVREAVFPTTSHMYSVERSRVDDRDDLRALWHRHDPASAAIALDAWLERAPDLVRTIRDRAGTVVGCSILADWRDVPHSLERDDPIMAAWAQHAAAQPAPCGAMHPRAPTRAERRSRRGTKRAASRRVARREAGVLPIASETWPAVRGARRPVTVPRRDARPRDQPVWRPVPIDDRPFHLAALDFGPDSVDGWLTRIAGRGTRDPGCAIPGCR